MVAKLDRTSTPVIKAWRQRLRKGDTVEVRDAKWTAARVGKIINVTARGCGVNTEGHDIFAYWNDIFPEAKEAAQLVGASKPALHVVPAAEPRAPLTSLPGMVRMTRSEEMDGHSFGKFRGETLNGKPEERPVKRRQRGRHHPTQISHIVRRERLKRSMDQDQFADLIKVSSGRIISRYELGAALPTDDVLIQLAEACSLDLDDLIKALDGQVTKDVTVTIIPVSAPESAPEEPDVEPVLAEEKKEEVASVPLTIPNPLVAPGLARARSDAEDVDWFMAALDFTDKLKLALPFPEKLEERRAWYRTALMMFETYLKAQSNVS